MTSQSRPNVGGGVVVQHTGTQDARESRFLETPRVIGTGRYALPARPYEWRGLRPIYRDPVLERVRKPA